MAEKSKASKAAKASPPKKKAAPKAKAAPRNHKSEVFWFDEQAGELTIAHGKAAGKGIKPYASFDAAREAAIDQLLESIERAEAQLWRLKQASG